MLTPQSYSVSLRLSPVIRKSVDRHPALVLSIIAAIRRSLGETHPWEQPLYIALNNAGCDLPSPGPVRLSGPPPMAHSFRLAACRT